MLHFSQIHRLLLLLRNYGEICISNRPCRLETILVIFHSTLDSILPISEHFGQSDYDQTWMRPSKVFKAELRVVKKKFLLFLIKEIKGLLL